MTERPAVDPAVIIPGAVLDPVENYWCVDLDEDGKVLALQGVDDIVGSNDKDVHFDSIRVDLRAVANAVQMLRVELTTLTNTVADIPNGRRGRSAGGVLS